MNFYNYLITNILIIFFWGCSGLEQSESKKQRQVNLVIEPIKRKVSDHFFTVADPCLSQNEEVYSWRTKYIGNYPRITKEFFRCKGNPLNPPISIQSETYQITYQIDCGGMEQHSLPIREKKEFIYPILIDLLNLIQKKTKKRVVITSGHRCPTHNLYVDSSKNNRVSKHLIGAEVDFYVEGMEYEPLAIISILKEFYKDDNRFKALTNIKNQWINKEITLTYHERNKNCNGDNRHDFPYLTIEVTYNRESQKPVHFSWHLGYNGFYRND